MPLDEATHRFSFLLQRDLRKLADEEESRTARGEALRYDSVSRLAVYESRGGDVAGRLYGEVLASYSADDRIFRWAWAGRSPSASATHGDAIFREGQARAVPQLAMSVVADLDPDEALTLARLGALTARARALHVRDVPLGTSPAVASSRSPSFRAASVEFVGLFERPRPSDESRAAEARYSVPPPPPASVPGKTTPAPPRAYRSLPPIREVWEPRVGGSRARSEKAPSSAAPPGGARALREPAREAFLPVANAALAALARKCAGYKQGLFVVVVDEAASRARRGVLVQLVAVDAQGLLVALDPATDLLEAAAQMVDDDRRRGNVWRRLSARVTPKPDGGATLHVDVV